MVKIMMMVVVSMMGFVSEVYAQEGHVAMIKNISGQVKVIRHDKTLVAIAGMQLFRLDKIVSAQDSGGGIAFIDGTLVTIGASTTIEVSQYIFEPSENNYDFSLYMSKGTAIYSSGRLGKLAPEQVSLNTPRATVGIRGTRYIVKVDGE